MQAIGCVSRKSSAAATVSLPVSVGQPVHFRCHLPCSKLSVEGRKSPGSIWYWPMGSKVFRTCRMPDKWTHLAVMLLAIPSRTVRGSKPQSIPAPSLTSLHLFGPHVAKVLCHACRSCFDAYIIRHLLALDLSHHLPPQTRPTRTTGCVRGFELAGAIQVAGLG